MVVNVPNERQAQLIQDIGMDTSKVGVRFESEDILVLLHHKSHNDVTLSRAKDATVYTPLDKRQMELCREVSLDPNGVRVRHENAEHLRLYHYISDRDVTLYKSESQKRKEKELKLW